MIVERRIFPQLGDDELMQSLDYKLKTSKPTA